MNPYIYQAHAHATYPASLQGLRIVGTYSWARQGHIILMKLRVVPTILRPETLVPVHACTGIVAAFRKVGRPIAHKILGRGLRPGE